MNDLFDYEESQRLKHEGMDRATVDVDLMRIAKEIAVSIAQNNGGECNADMVGQELHRRGLPHNLGHAAGSLFKGSRWEFTGKRIRSSRKKNHGREIKVWRLVR